MSNCRSRFAVHLNLFVLSALFLLVALPAYAGRAPISTTLTLSSSEVAQGVAVTLTANVTADGDGVYPGTVNFYDSYGLDTNLLVGTAQLNTSGSASIVRTLGPGTHSLVAIFAGYNGSSSSTSTAQSIKVNRTTYTSTTTLSDSGVPGNYSLTAAVTGSGPNAPSGSVSFNDTTLSNLLGAVGLGSPTVTTGFSAPNALTSGSEPVGIATGDLNGDGKMDIVVTNYQSESVSVFLGNGDGTFQTAQTTALSSSYSVALVLADFNNDGKLDMAVTAENGGGVTILLGNGDGTFQPPTVLQPGSQTYGIVAGDFNGDGNIDLAVATWNNGNGVTILLGNGDGTFQEPTTTGQYAELLAVGDFNNDGKLDLALTSQEYGTVVVMLGNGDGTFQEAQSYVVGSNPYYVATGDFNGDGKLDLVVSNLQDSTVSVLLGNGDGTFNPQVAYPAGSEGAGVQVVDINSDGKPDLVVADVASSSVSLLLGNGDGTFQSPSSYPAGPEAYLSAVADFNGDGALDMAISDIGSNTVSVLLNSTGWTATATVTGVAVSGNSSHNVTASYSGDELYTASTSGPVVLIGSSTATVASLSASSSSIIYGGSVQLTASIAPYTSGDYVATGSFTFYDGASELATVTISNGQAGYTASSLAAGAHNFTVAYSGDSNFVQSTSAVTTVNVTPDFSLGSNGSTPGTLSSTVMPGGTAVYVLQFSPVGSSTFPNTVGLALTGLPAGATYTVSPSSISASSGTTTVTVTVNTAKQQSTAAATRLHVPAFAYAMLVPLFGMLRLRRTLRARMKSCLPLLLLLALALVMATAACSSGSGFFSQTPQSYPLTLTGTSGALHHSVALNLTVQ